MTDTDLAAQVTLCDALDRILNRGVVLYADITISVAGVDLLYLGLRGLVSAVDTLREHSEREIDLVSHEGNTTREPTEPLVQ